MEKHYDVGIVGWWANLNYGGTMTYYALNTVLKSMGKSVLMIQRSHPQKIEPSFDTVPGRFSKKYYDISDKYTYEEMKELNNLCDSFVAGSDQLWNPYLMSCSGPEFFLSFAADDKVKISYATSFGNISTCSAEFKDKYGPLLKRLDGISVREDFAVDVCKSNFDLNAYQVCDPVFLCDIEKYKEIADTSKKKYPEKYVLNFLLDPNKEKTDACAYVRSKLSINDYVNFTDLQQVEERVRDFGGEFVNANAEIEDFVKAYRDAEFVVTDSFHGTCFAIIFGKPFISFANMQRGEKRFVSLLKWLKQMDRLVYDINDVYAVDSLLTPIDYTETNKIIAEEKKRGMEWLERAMAKDNSVSPVSEKTDISAKKYNTVMTANISCTGCSACASSCPKNAITMRDNDEGFSMPVVDNNKCVDCGLCLKRCPVLNPSYKNDQEPQCYAMMADDELRMKSSSGGMFTVIAEHIIDNGGYVCGAAYAEDFTVHHIIVDSKEQLWRMRGSKYMQSHIDNAHIEVKKLLEEGKTVLFTGMPCQISGLYSFLGKDYDNLYTVDILCHGITSSKVFEKYHKDVLGGKKLERLEFKAKEPWGWHAGVNAYFADGTRYSQPLERDPYFIAYLESISKSSSCAGCKFNRLPRQGDLTIGDFWGINRNDPEMNDGKGTSVVLLNNEKAVQIFDTLKPAMKKVKKEELNVAISGNMTIIRPHMLHKNRDEFFKRLNQTDFATLTDACFKNRIYEIEHDQMMKNFDDIDIQCYYLAKTVAEKSRGRKIATWIHSPRFAKILRYCFGLGVDLCLTKMKEKVEENKIHHISEMKGKKDEYYIVCLDAPCNEENYALFADYGYKEYEDFVFYKHNPIVLQNFNCSSGRYCDAYGNTIEGDNAVISSVVFRGYNSHIVIGKGVTGTTNLHFDMGTNQTFTVGDGTRFNDAVHVEMFDYAGSAKVEIGNNCRFSDALIRLYSDVNCSSVLINDNCTFETNFDLHANCGKKVIIGKDCMFSHDVVIFAGDGHTIFNVNTRKNVNSDYNNLPIEKNKLVVGEHVWIGKGAFIKHGANIGDGSIVASKAVVTKRFPNNCSIGGNPARQLSPDLAWSRELFATNIESCGNPFYIAKTSQALPPISGLNVLVIGGTAQNGTQLVNELLSRGNNVTIATRGNKKDVFGTRIKRVRMDVTNFESVKNALEGQYFDVVFDNLAYGPVNVNNVINNVKCGKYIQLSSVAVYPECAIGMDETFFDPYTCKVEMKAFPIDNSSPVYGMSKAFAEAYLYQNISAEVPSVTVRIPYVAKTDRLYYYCRNIVNGIPMNIEDVSRCFTFVRDEEVGRFLVWIAGQDFTGPINFASSGFVKIDDMISYIEKQTGKKAIIDTVAGEVMPFIENSFSLNIDKATNLGYAVSDLNSWFWKDMDWYIARALREAKK